MVMKVNKEKLAELCALGDNELWREIRSIAASHGFSLPEKTPSHSEMQKMREAVSGGAKLRLGEAIRILNNYKRENK